MIVTTFNVGEEVGKKVVQHVLAPRDGKPLGIASYKPYQSSGEDFLHDYLGNLGLPIELTPEFPTEARLVLLTESARQDPRIVPKIQHQLVSGKSVVITSGLLRALQGRGCRGGRLISGWAAGDTSWPPPGPRN